MLEWTRIPETVFVNASGISTRVKIIHEFPQEPVIREIETNGRDIDLIAFDELGDEAESLRLLELNARAYAEWDFRQEKILKIKVPA